MFKKGDKVILNLHTKCGDCYIDKRSHNKEFIVELVFMPNRTWDYVIRSTHNKYEVWHVKNPMLTLADPQLQFDFMKD